MLSLLLLLLGPSACASGQRRRQSTGPGPISGALFGVTKGMSIDVYVAIGESRTFRFDERTFESMSVRFTAPFDTVVSHAEGADTYEAASKLFVGITRIQGTPPQFPAGLVATVSFAEGTDMANVRIDYTNPQETYIEVGEEHDAITCSGEGAAFLVLSGDSETEQDLRLFTTQAEPPRGASLAFSRPIGGLVDVPATFLASSGEVVSAFGAPASYKIGWGVFEEPNLLPTAAIFSTLTFAEPLSLALLAVSNGTAVDGYEYEPLDVQH